jgi:DNA-directed RNA polymerase specialized sigma24 family protein
MEFAEDQKELVAGCLRADSTAWEIVIRRHGPGIGRLVHRYASLRGEVEDIKQEVFLKVFCKLSTFRVDEGNLSSWITRIGRI